MNIIEECEKYRIEHDLERRMHENRQHHSKSIAFLRVLSKIDSELFGSYFCVLFNERDHYVGERILYEMDVYFELDDARAREERKLLYAVMQMCGRYFVYSFTHNEVIGHSDDVIEPSISPITYGNFERAFEITHARFGFGTWSREGYWFKTEDDAREVAGLLSSRDGWPDFAKVAVAAGFIPFDKFSPENAVPVAFETWSQK